MASQRLRNLRVVWAIAAKDLTDGIKNKVILQTLLTVVLLVALYRALPLVTGSSRIPQVTAVDPDSSAWVQQLEESHSLVVRRVTTLQSLRVFVAMGGTPELGLIVDGADTVSGPLLLDGYVQHWVSEAQAQRLAVQVEGIAAEALGRPVTIAVAGHRVYPTMEAFGPHTWAAFSLVLVLVLLGMSLTPQLMLEEKRTHTMDALLVSPAARGDVVAGKACAGLLYCLLGGVLVLVVNHGMIVQWPLALAGVVAGSCLAVAVGLLLGTVVEHEPQIRIWVAALITPLFILPAVVSFMAMDMPKVLTQVVYWFPSVALSRLLVRSMTRDAAQWESVFDVTLVLVVAWLALRAVAWRLQQADR
jgi:hypothetical protein